MENLNVFIANHLGLVYLLAASLIALMFIEYLRAKRSGMRVGPKEAVHLINKNNAVVVDIRSKDNFRDGHIVDAVNMPAQETLESPKKLDKYKAKPIVVVCSNGAESQKAAATLAKQGYNTYALAGGMRAWSDAAFPIVKDA